MLFIFACLVVAVQGNRDYVYAQATFWNYNDDGCPAKGTVTQSTFQIGAGEQQSGCQLLLNLKGSASNRWCDLTNGKFYQNVYEDSKDCSGDSIQQVFEVGKCSSNFASGVSGDMTNSDGNFKVVSCRALYYDEPCFARDSLAVL